MTKEEMLEIKSIMNEVMTENLKPIEAKLDTMQEDIDILKDESAITRDGVNRLGIWAEKADRVLNIGLYEKA
jgi:hypothetical protein